MKKKVTVFVDGFNVFHSMNDDRSLKQYKWLNLHSLAEQMIDKSKEEVTKIYYFSAIYNLDPGKAQRHHIYIKALKSIDVEIVLGKFKYKHKTCRKCGSNIPTPEEKKTDVNIAIHLLKAGWQNDCDKVLIISGDTDLIPAIDMFKQLFPLKLLSVAFPIKRHNNEIEERVGSEHCRKIKEQHLSKAQFSDPIKYHGSELSKPLNWI